MAVEVDKSAATKTLNESFLLCSQKPVSTAPIKDTIDFVLQGRNCLTYRYIMFTALLAKAVNPAIDILSLQAKDSSEGAYDARGLAKDVVFQFQKTMLGNTLDGSNSDPLVNKPGRFERLREDNPVAPGEPATALNLLCQNLPSVQNKEDARQCVDYIVSVLLSEKNNREAQRNQVRRVTGTMGVFQTYRFLSDLLDQGFGGAALVLSAVALYHLQFSEDCYRILAHPVNQSGTSKRQYSDLDILRDEVPFVGIELKDKPFSSSDVEHAAETAFSAGAKSLLFVAGRQSNFASQPPTYFTNARARYAKRGMYVGLTSIDSLLDTVFANHMDMNPAHVLDVVRETAESIGAIEAQMWIYKYLATLQ